MSEDPSTLWAGVIALLDEKKVFDDNNLMRELCDWLGACSVRDMNEILTRANETWDEYLADESSPDNRGAEEEETDHDMTMRGITIVPCKFCQRFENVSRAYLHADGWVCKECWDERLKITE